jgi:hypothetical protein
VVAVVVIASLGLLAAGADRREHLSYSHCGSSLVDWGPDAPDVPYESYRRTSEAGFKRVFIPRQLPAVPR